jgi:RNA-binding protein
MSIRSTISLSRRAKKMEMKKMKEKANRLEPIMRIGKSGLTENVMQDIRGHLKRRGLIKIRMLRSFSTSNEKDSAASRIAEETGSKIVSFVGNSLVISKGNHFQKSLNKKETKSGERNRISKRR